MTHTTKENRDIYYRKAKEEGYRARSAYKLLHIFESFHILYPLIDEDSALSILLNSSCKDCKNKVEKGDSKVKKVRNYDINNSKFLNNSHSHSLNHSHSKSESHSDSESECDSDFVDYDRVNRNCFDLGRVKNVVDLCSAPGSWSQLLRNLVYHDYYSLKAASERFNPQKSVCRNLVQYLNTKPVIVAIDLQQMAPLEGVHFLKGDITDPSVLNRVLSLFTENVTANASQALEGSSLEVLRRNAQLITCDGAPDVSGLHETDSFLQSSLIRSSLSVCQSLLDIDGSFICKTFFNSQETPIFAEVSSFFDYCTIFKPPSSRPSSFEHFIVAMGFKPMGHMMVLPSERLLTNGNKVYSEKEIEEIVRSSPQVLSGDLSPYDRLMPSLSSVNPSVDEVT